MSMQLEIYRRSPRHIQDLITTVQGLRFKRLRYTEHTWETLEWLQRSQYWPAEEMRRYQDRKLRDLVTHAQARSPYYRTLYGSLGIESRQIHGLEDLPKLPVISKAELRAHNMDFVATDLDRRRCSVSYTSGSTGTPLTSFHSRRSVQERFAFLERLFQWYNPVRMRKRASFTGRLVVNPASGPPFHRNNPFLRQQVYSSHHLTPANLQHYVEELAAFQPEQIDGLCSAIYVVADYITRSNQTGKVRPKVAVVTSETLMPHVRERIQTAFGCPVANQYGSQEGAPLAYECPEGGFHICPESGVFEILDEEGKECPPGERGQLVVTSFLSEGMPLIRYAIGDLSAWGHERCPCGRTSALITTIEGRVDDLFITSERGIVPRLDSAFKGLPNSIVATQVAQKGHDRFEVRIVPDPKRFAESDAQKLVQNLRNYLGKNVVIEVRLVAEIPRTRGGKMPAMVNESDDPALRSAILERWNASPMSVGD